MGTHQIQSSSANLDVSICSVQFSGTDRIRLNGLPFPGDLIIPLRSAIESSWRSGIKDEAYFHGAHEFKPA